MNRLARIIAWCLFPFRWLLTLRRTVGAPVLLTKNSAGYRMALGGHVYVKHGASPWFDERHLVEADKSVARVLSTATNAIVAMEAIDYAETVPPVIAKALADGTKQAAIRSYEKPKPCPEDFGFELIQTGGSSQTTVVRFDGQMWHSVGCIKWYNESGQEDGSGPNSLWKRWERYAQATKSHSILAKALS